MPGTVLFRRSLRQSYFVYKNSDLQLQDIQGQIKVKETLCRWQRFRMAVVSLLLIIFKREKSLMTIHNKNNVSDKEIRLMLACGRGIKQIIRSIQNKFSTKCLLRIMNKDIFKDPGNINLLQKWIHNFLQRKKTLIYNNPKV